MLYGYSKQILRSHFENNHNIPKKWENRNFKSITEFQTWKLSLEKETKPVYVLLNYFKSVTE